MENQPQNNSNIFPIIIIFIFIFIIFGGLIFGSIYFVLFPKLHTPVKEIKNNSAKEKEYQERLDFNKVTNETKLLFGEGKFEEGIKSATKALELAHTDEGKAIGHYWLGLMNYRLRNLSVAQKELEEAVKLDPKYAAAYATLASIINEQGNPVLGLQYADKAIEYDPQYPWSYNNKAVILFNLGRKSEAITLFEKATQLSPETYVFQDNLTRARQAAK